MRNKVIGGGLLFGIAAFVYLFVQMQSLTSAAGNSYPLYSSLRSDPLGAKALHDALAETGEYQVSRSYKPVRAERAPNALILRLGMTSIAWSLSGGKPEGWEKMALAGARVVVALHGSMPDEKPSKGMRSIEARLQIHLYGRTIKAGQTTEPVTKNSELGLRIDDPIWSCLLNGEQGCLVAERTYGKGSVVLTTRPYLLSNEGLRTSRDAVLLAAILGTPQMIIFDEESLGIEESGSLMGLLRRYRLTAALCVLLAWGVLFIWRGSSSLLPHRPSGVSMLAGRGSVAGLTNLLRRSISEKQLIATCLEEWKKSKTVMPAYQLARVARMELAAAETTGSLVETYRKIAKILQEK